jgi:acyl carrier protein
MSDVQAIVKQFILKEFLPDTNPSELTESTPLVTAAILDSLATLRLVAFLEERFGIELQAHEASVENLNTIQDIERLVRSKRS